jgi:hypothetical protein
MQILERQVGTTTRLRVATGGETRFVKRPSSLLRARIITELAGITEAETRFYLELAGEIPIRIPAVVSARHRPWSFELVIEDLVGAGCTLLPPGASLSVEQARQVLESLASLHAAFWQDPRLDGSLSWLTDLRRREVALGNRLARPMMALGLVRAGPLVPPSIRDGARRYAAERERVCRVLAEGPRTVIHHDCHPGNLFWTADGAPGLLDWQLVRSGSWASDVAYLLATGLTTPDRRAHGDALLRHYLEALPEPIRPDPPSAHERIRRHTAYAFEAMLLTLALGALMPREDIRRLVHRTAVAVLDAESFSALGLS